MQEHGFWMSGIALFVDVNYLAVDGIVSHECGSVGITMLATSEFSLQVGLVSSDLAASKQVFLWESAPRPLHPVGHKVGRGGGLSCG